MTKMIKLVAVAALAMTATASAEQVWECRYTGHWASGGHGDGGEFTWVLTWRTHGADWDLVGDYSDRFGRSTLDGRCHAYECNMKQRYTSGELDGKTYYWHGTYSDSDDGPGRSINKFTGTWGDSRDNRSNGGTWSARAVCRRQ